MYVLLVNSRYVTNMLLARHKIWVVMTIVLIFYRPVTNYHTLNSWKQYLLFDTSLSQNSRRPQLIPSIKSHTKVSANCSSPLDLKLFFQAHWLSIEFISFLSFPHSFSIFKPAMVGWVFLMLQLSLTSSSSQPNKTPCFYKTCMISLTTTLLPYNLT